MAENERSPSSRTGKERRPTRTAFWRCPVRRRQPGAVGRLPVDRPGVHREGVGAQLGEHAVSAVDHASGRLAAADAPVLSEPVGFEKELKDAQEAAAKAAAGKAEKVQGV
jgi:hypothetical protein